MKRILSRYNFKYPRSLVYMMQASEYNIREFFDWYKKVKDFGEVEQRKSLVKTLKATLLLLVLWLFAAASILFVLSKGKLLFFVIYLLLLPYIIVGILTLCTYLLNQIQKPIEKRIINKAKAKLKNHKALKIGIAGSYGKTTMKEILKTVLGASKKVAATPATKNTPACCHLPWTTCLICIPISPTNVLIH